MGETRGRRGFAEPLVAVGAMISAAALISACAAEGTQGYTSRGSSAAPPGEASPGASGAASSGESADPSRPGPKPTLGQDGRRGVCQAATMKGRIKIQGAAAGSTYAVLIVTNDGERPCDATGYVGMRLRDARNRPLPTDVRREGRQLRNLVILPPGESAYTELRWSTVPATGDAQAGPCQRPAETVEVTAPDDTRQFRVDWNGSSVCSQGRITTSPLRTGQPPTKHTG